MRKEILALAISAALVVPTAAQAQSASRVFKSSAPWALDYGDDYCRLTGTFTHEGDEVYLQLERIQPSNQARLSITSKSVKTFRSATAVTYRLMPVGNDTPAPFVVGNHDGGLKTMHLGNVTIAEPFDFTAEPTFVFPPYNRDDEKKYAAGVTSIAFTDGLTKPITINTGKMSGPIGALQGCADDLLQVWDLDVEKHRTMKSAAVPAEDASKWLPEGTIGFGDFESLSASRNTIRVMIDAAGKPTDCKIQWPSLKEKTNNEICGALMENGKFTPAKDADGNAMASYWMVEPFLLMSFG